MKILSILTLFIAVSIIISSCKDEIDPCEDKVNTYDSNIKALVDASCAISGCHDAGSDKGDYTTYDNMKSVLNEDKFEKRILIDQDMPPTGPVSDAMMVTFQCWADAGYPES